MTTIDDVRLANLGLLIAKYGGQRPFADAISKSPAQVSQWVTRAANSKTGKPRNVSTASARLIEEKCGLVAGWMDQEHAADEVATLPSIRVPAFTIRGVDGKDGLDPETDVMIPVADVEVSAGSPDSPLHFEFLPTRYELPYQLAWLHANGARPKDILIMPVRGRSMEPVLWHGDKVVLHRGRTRVQDGAVYAIVTPDGARVKRLYNRPEGGLRIVSDNADKQRYPDETVRPEDMHRVLVLGQAIDRMGSGGLAL